jgi:all-trans-retinol 13,14-reductase
MFIVEVRFDNRGLMENMTEKYDVIVIGAGVGGLTCGAYLSKHGLKTLIIDKNPFVGGYCSVFKRGEFTFHAGPEGMVGLGQEGFLMPSLKELGIEKAIEFMRIEPLDRTYFCGMDIITSTNMEEYIKSLQNHFPGDKDSIPKFFDAMIRIKKEVTSPDFEIPKGLWSMIKFACRFSTTAKYGRKTFKQILDAFFNDQRLKFLLGFYPSNWFGVPPSELLAPWAAVVVASAYTEGLYYPKGGIQRLSECIFDAFKKNGGEFVLGKAVSKVLIENGRAVGVQLENGETFRGENIVSNADVKQTFLRLVGEQYFEEFSAYVSQLKQSVSGFTVYLGVDEDLRNFDCQFNYLGEEKEADWDAFHQTLRSGQLSLKGMGIRVISNLEPSFAPAGKSSVVLINLAPYGYMNNWRTGPNGERTKEYKALKKEVADSMIQIAEAVIPDLPKKIIVQDAATPLTFQRYTWNSEGAWYGPCIGQNMPPSVTPIRSLYLAGSNTKGAGVPEAFISGIETAKQILSSLKTRV